MVGFYARVTSSGIASNAASIFLKAMTLIPAPPRHLLHALRAMIRSPRRTIVPPWSWKAAAFTAALRALAFFLTNLPAGPGQATKAMLIEAVYAIFAAGLVGAISQQLRFTEPLWATALVVWFGLPGVALVGQWAVHHLAHTPHQAGGLIFSFCLAAPAAAFTWYAMRQGSMLGGVDATTILSDLKALPQISLGFLLLLPRYLMRLHRQEKATEA